MLNDDDVPMGSLIDRYDQIFFGEDIDIATPAFDAVVTSLSPSEVAWRKFLSFFDTHRVTYDMFESSFLPFFVNRV